MEQKHTTDQRGAQTTLEVLSGRVTQDQKSRFKSLLEKSGLPYRSIKVFGSLRLNAHVETKSFDAAEKWALFLNRITGGCPVKFHETLADYANGHPTDTCLNKKKHKIWRVYVAV